ncbi:hypothetical protein K443DRAFT_289889 [Laccaria amethystina LaAM-08-1]|uniref:Uncharacterized protein n=1 Tax=Laccaria amethystina LaAM-08-1 TaxID=1095629 RepID=A0A0C9XXC3_9AGAR|nr:hypothetical protein K443DRAFT_289889 [Laccaria amethystina LaAM-08-1]
MDVARIYTASNHLWSSQFFICPCPCIPHSRLLALSTAEPLRWREFLRQRKTKA